MDNYKAGDIIEIGLKIGLSLFVCSLVLKLLLWYVQPTLAGSTAGVNYYIGYAATIDNRYDATDYTLKNTNNYTVEVEYNRMYESKAEGVKVVNILLPQGEIPTGKLKDYKVIVNKKIVGLWTPGDMP